MYKIVARMLVLAVMLTAFLGQAMAFTASTSCGTSSKLHTNHLSEFESQVHDQIAELENSADCCEIDCCDTVCICIANGCVSFIFLQSDTVLIKAVTLREAPYTQEFELKTPFATLLYRPPILVS